MSPSKEVSETGMSDRELAARCAAGDREAFERLYSQQAGRLYNLAYRMAGSEDAEDLLQEIFLQAYRKIASYKGESSLGTWLYRLGVNLCLDHLRSRQGRMGKVTDSLDEEGADPVVEPGGPVEVTAIARLDLERAIVGLAPSYRTVFVLHDIEGYQHDEVAHLLAITEGSSKSLLHKARMKLRARLGARV